MAAKERRCVWVWVWVWWNVVAGVVPEGEREGSRFVASGSRWGGEGPQCPPGCTCSAPELVWCRASTPELYPPHPAASTTTLLLEGYQVVPPHLLARLTHLRHLQVRQSRQLRDMGTLPPLPHLQVLELHHNHLDAWRQGGLAEAWPGLTHLLLAHNNFTTLPATALAGLTHLTHLDLSHNPIISVGPGALRSLVALASLNLSHCHLHHLPHAWLQDAPRLAHLNLSHTGLIHLPQLAGDHLHLVDASHNNLTELPEGLIAGAGVLEDLLLHHNPLRHVRAAVLTGNGSLRILHLHHTLLVNMDEFVFTDVAGLQELRLDHIPSLQRVEHGAFTGLHHLHHLRLDHTPALHEIEEVAFAGLPSLHSLDLRRSGLTVLPRSLSLLARANTSVLLDGTAVRCDCHHSWLPSLLLTHNVSSWSGINPLLCTHQHQHNITQLANLMVSLRCAPPHPIGPTTGKVKATGTQSILLHCNVTAQPHHRVLWLSASHQLFRYNGSSGQDDLWLGHQLRQAEQIVDTDPRFQVLQSGHLLVKEVLRQDVGWFKCFAYNSVGNTSLFTFLTLSDAPFRSLYIESLLFGFACAALFLLVTLVVQLVNYLMDRLGCACCCCKNRVSHKARQVRRLLESVEVYKSQQLDRLRENYNCQVVSIKESCYQQMERIRESYSTQGKNLRDLCDYSTQGLTSLRDQYVDQVTKVRDYSVSQMNRVRENYVFQRHRIRKFSAHQLLRLRETYKYQQKTLNKILENLPDLYLQNCRTGGCQRTDSLVFDDALHGIDAYKVDFLDAQSFHSSDYFTPASTLTHSFRSTRGQEPVRQHSTTSSNTSNDYMEALPWSRRESSILGSSSPSRIFPVPSHSHHSRSLSVTGPVVITPDTVKVHKRSLSACHPYHRVVPAPESRGVPARITLREESAGSSLNPPPAPSSVPTTPTHFSCRRLVLDSSEGESKPHITPNSQASNSIENNLTKIETNSSRSNDTGSEEKVSSDSDKSVIAEGNSPVNSINRSDSKPSAHETSF